MTAKLTLNKNVLGRLVYKSSINPDGATYSKAGSYTFVPPITGNYTIECYGAGGGGGGAGGTLFIGSSGGGGGGGGYGKSVVALTAGVGVSLTVGAGGVGGTGGAGVVGGDSSCSGVIGHGGGGGAVASAPGGLGGVGGTGVGTTTATGTTGNQGLTTSDGKGGAGAGPGGGAGGAGGGALVGPASDGLPYGGGGGGALSSSTPNLAGGRGGDGAVQFSWSGTNEFIYVGGCEGPCETYRLGRWAGTVGGKLVYLTEQKCCKYPLTDIAGNPLTVGFHEQATYPPGISDYLTVVLSGDNCPVLGANHCVIGEAKWGTAMAWAPSGFGWQGTIAGLTFNIWVDASCPNPIRFCIISACNSTTTFAGPADACGSCAASPCGSPCPYATVTCNFPLRASVSYTVMGHCCPGFVTDCTSHGTFTILGYCRRGSLGRYVHAQVVPLLSSDKGGPITNPEPGVFTGGPDCPCPPVPFCPKYSPACCDVVEACNCPPVNLTASNGSGTLTCFNGSTGTLPCGTLLGTLRTWSGTVAVSPACGGITSLSASVQCDGSTGQWSVSLQAGAVCTFSGGTVTSVDCVNRIVTIRGLTGSGMVCSGSSLDVTITW